MKETLLKQKKKEYDFVVLYMKYTILYIFILSIFSKHFIRQYLRRFVIFNPFFKLINCYCFFFLINYTHTQRNALAKSRTLNMPQAGQQFHHCTSHFLTKWLLFVSTEITFIYYHMEPHNNLFNFVNRIVSFTGKQPLKKDIHHFSNFHCVRLDHQEIAQKLVIGPCPCGGQLSSRSLTSSHIFLFLKLHIKSPIQVSIQFTSLIHQPTKLCLVITKYSIVCSI